LQRKKVPAGADEIVAAAPTFVACRSSVCVSAFRPEWALSSRACHPRPRSRQQARIGFTRIKHDGYRLMARRDPAASGCSHLPARSCLIDGDVVACDENGLAIFDRLRHGQRRKSYAMLVAFDLLELDGADDDALGGGPLVRVKQCTKAG
jgi:hypothetical protein